MTSHPVATVPSTDDDGGRHHGEYKVPGGKLVVADFDVVDGVLANVSLSGDFFLEPDEALPEINRALTGLPIDTSAADIADAVTAALPEGTVLDVEVHHHELAARDLVLAVQPRGRLSPCR